MRRFALLFWAAWQGVHATWDVLSGGCEHVEDSDGTCITSPNYPADYTNGQECLIRVGDLPIYVSAVAFRTESYYDQLFVDRWFMEGRLILLTSAYFVVSGTLFPRALVLVRVL